MLDLEPGSDETHTYPVLPPEISRIELAGNGRRRSTQSRPEAPAPTRRNGSPRTRPAPAQSASDLFERLAEFTDPSLLDGSRMTYRFDVQGAGSWHVTIDAGSLTVVESEEAADCVVRTSEETLMGILRGEQNATTAFLAGLLQVEGDLAIATKLEHFHIY
jgi:SCP-2 sterol transfer family